MEEADSYAMSELARGMWSTVNAGNSADTLVTTKTNLPASDYSVAVLVSGLSGTLGQARVNGGAWIPLNIQNGTDTWVPLGVTTAGTTSVTVELDPTVADLAFKYHGLPLEGSVMSARPVAGVLARLTNREPVSIVMMGDSVTEDASGTSGGSTSFAAGAPGLLRAWMRSFYTNSDDVAYWPTSTNATGYVWPVRASGQQAVKRR